MCLRRHCPESSPTPIEDLVSTLELNISTAVSGSIMVDTMSQPLNSWAPEPVHRRYYPQELPGPGLQLPSLSSTVDMRDSNHGHLPASATIYGQGGSRQMYQDTPPTIRPNLHMSPRSPSSAGKHYPAPSTTRHLEDGLNGHSPTYSSSISSRPTEASELQRNYPSSRGQTSYQAPFRPVHDQRPAQIRPHPEPLHAGQLPPQAIREFQPEPPFRSLASPHMARSPKLDSRPHERVRISDLLSGEPVCSPRSRPQARTAPVQSPITPPMRHQYKINVRQQPFAARSCGFGERDRRVIDPPPIVELKIDDAEATPEEIREGLRVPFAVMHCTIWNEASDQDISFMPEEYRQQRRLMGTTVSSPFNGRDNRGAEGCFFCFPDLSVRTSGSFRLKFVLVLVNPSANFIGARHPVRAQVVSDVFTVYSAKDFPGMQASTPLTRKLKEQGCLISIKKGNDKGPRGRDDSDDNDDDDDDEGDAGGLAAATATKRRKQRK